MTQYQEVLLHPQLLLVWAHFVAQFTTTLLSSSSVITHLSCKLLADVGLRDMHFFSSLGTLLITDRIGIARLKEESQVGWQWCVYTFRMAWYNLSCSWRL